MDSEAKAIDVRLKTLNELTGWSVERTLTIGTGNQREAIKRAIRAAIELEPELIGVEVTGLTNVEVI